ncbi:hypothetical protein ACFQJ7_06180 [Halovenus rubra]|uniref:Uncharacterized protein n=2 Tax=Halovenus rubra TaxID=869890 RepID=A0ACC7DYT4_9EURY|nr:hypothetical protein [Halovenus rubra]
MSRYERTYGTSWETLDDEEAMERAYALGVAATLGTYHPDELDAIRDEMGSAYQRSVIDLAFDEGKTEARNLERPEDNSQNDGVWSSLVEGELRDVDTDDIPTGGRQGLPEAVDRADLLDRPDFDSTEAVNLPEFLQKDSDE